jgi:hypothetical protein
MTSYRVSWAVDVDADTPEEAARLTLAMQRDPAGIATVFDVQPEQGGPAARIDLDALGGRS